MRYAIILALLGCNEISIDKFGDADEPTGDTDGLSPVDTDGSGTGTDTDDVDPTQDDPFTNGELPPNVLDGPCPEGATATWLSGELVRFAEDRGPAIGTLRASQEGWFHVYDLSSAESGASQRNESYFLRIPTSANADGYPIEETCHGDWVAIDPDNNGTPTERLYLGTFHLDAGDNSVQFFHLCAHVHNGGCEELLDLSVPGHHCNENINSVHFTGEALCIVAAE